GFIRASGFNLVASAKRDGRRLIGVVFGGQSQPWRDHQMKRLLDQGFARALDGETMLAMANVRDPVVSDTAPQARLVRLDLDDLAAKSPLGEPPAPGPGLKTKPSVTSAALATPARKGAKPAPAIDDGVVGAAPLTGAWLVQVGAFRGQAQATAASRAA